MRVSAIFEPSASELDRLVREYPLAHVVSWKGDQVAATPLPLIRDTSTDHTVGIAAFIGHFSRHNPQVDLVRSGALSLAIFTGPHAYISPSWLTDRTQAPTWNFATAQFRIDIELIDKPAFAREAVYLLSAQMEEGRPKAWNPAEMHGRFDRLLDGVIPFRARVTGLKAKFKLGQNERRDVFVDMMSGLAAEQLTDVMDAMARHRRN